MQRATSLRRISQQNRRVVIAWLFILALISGVGPTAWAEPASLTVCNGGCAYTSIQAAINAAPAGATVIVSAGTYRERLHIRSSVRVIGAGPDLTIVQGDGNATVVSISGVDRSTVLEGMTIAGGGGSGGGGVHISGASPTLRRLRIVNNTLNSGPTGGGLLIVGGANPLLEEVEVRGNRATAGAAVGVWDAQATLRRCTVADNVGQGPGGSYFGAIYADSNSTVVIEESTVRNNTGALGAGLSLVGNSTATVLNSRFEGNQAQDQGGAILATGRSRLNLNGVEIVANRSARDGAGVTVHNATATIVNSLFTGNSAARDGGALNILEGSTATVRSSVVEYNQAARFTGGIGVQGASQATIERTLIRYNAVSGADPDPSGGTSGGLKIFGAGTRATVRFSRIEGNEARDGAGVYVETQASAILVGNEIVGNYARQRGAGIVVNDRAIATIENNVISNNHANESGGGLWVLDRSTAVVRQNIIGYNRANQSGGGMILLQDTKSFIEHNFFVGNEAGQHGGGLLLDSTSARVAHNRFRQNVAGGIGGGVLFQSNVTSLFANNAVQGNRSGLTGDGVAVYFSSPAVVGNLIMGNDPAGGGEGIYMFHSSVAVLASNLILHNGVGIGASGSAWPGLYARNNVYGNHWANYQGIGPGAGDVSVDPLFVEGTYFLSHVDAGQAQNSPLIDAGHTTAQALGLHTLTTRTDGVPDQGMVDIGLHYVATSSFDSSKRHHFLPVVQLSP
ncbi:MAG: right-handed parallel beta-helix repeat-containing protein [Caldilineales bacterium]|nr:right-handed parallel beta-helix repeat-containing protein [Caldilineales bacterium]